MNHLQKIIAKKNDSKNRKIFFWSILALAMILRCIRFATVPDGIN